MGWVPPDPPPLPDDWVTKATRYYKMTLPNGTVIEVPCPDTLPQSGDILFFPAAAANYGWEEGDEVHLMERTDEAPHGKVSELGNWVVLTKKGRGVWANIEWLIADGVLKQLNL